MTTNARSNSNSRWTIFAATALMIGAAAACSSTTTSLPTDGLLPLGTWGGDGGGLIVSDTAMHLHVGCTYGDASGRITLGNDGRFDVGGSYLLRAFPIAVGPTMPARFTGRVEGNVVTVTATVNDTIQHTTSTLGPVKLTLGTEPKLGPCPICRRPIITQHSASHIGH